MNIKTLPTNPKEIRDMIRNDKVDKSTAGSQRQGLYEQ